MAYGYQSRSVSRLAGARFRGTEVCASMDHHDHDNCNGRRAPTPPGLGAKFGEALPVTNPPTPKKELLKRFTAS